MKLLAVGNSFSQDATNFLHQTAHAQGIDLDVFNLYIGGCSLERHCQNLRSGEAAYELQHNGQSTGKTVSLPEMLHEQDWDFIVTQQASHDSGWMDTYEPFLTDLLDTFRKAAPHAALAMQETWAYEVDSPHPNFPRYRCNQNEMYERLRHCYHILAMKHSIPLIPCGDVIQRLRLDPAFSVSNGGRSICRDGFHMSLSYGRYLLSCTWLGKLFGVNVKDNPFTPKSEEATDPALLQLIRDTAEEVLQEER